MRTSAPSTTPWRLAVLTGVGIVAFVAAIASFKTVPASECQMEAISDDDYQVSFAQPPTVDLTSHELIVTRSGGPVSRAQVCLRADMGGAGKMSGMGMSDEAREVSNGRYELPLRFMMGGHWNAQVVVRDPNREDAVSVPLTLQVQ